MCPIDTVDTQQFLHGHCTCTNIFMIKKITITRGNKGVHQNRVREINIIMFIFSHPPQNTQVDISLNYF